MFRLARFTLIGLALSVLPATAHEFWLSPEQFQIEKGDRMQVRLRVGQQFKGASYIYNPVNLVRFDLVEGGQILPVPGRMGDDPAMDLPASQEGLVVVVHETKDYTLTYTEWEKFVDFVEHKDFAGVIARHSARGLPETGFKESYRRYAKALIGVGAASGADRETGLKTEIVALANPYTDDVSEGLPVRVLLDGAARADVQVELYDQPSAEGAAVVVTKFRTDAEGRVTVPVTPGHSYMVDSVVLEDTGNDDPKAGPVWHSHWASLTFAVPSKD